MASTKNLISGISKWDNVDVNFGFVDYTAKIVPRWQPQQGYTPAAEPSYQDKVPMKNGWVTEDSRKYYYENNVKVTRAGKELTVNVIILAELTVLCTGTNCGNQLLHSFSWIKMVFV